MIKLICLLIIIIISIYGYTILKRNGDYFNPILSFIIPIFAGYIFFLVYFADETSDRTIVIYILGILSFVLGFVAHRRLVHYPYEYIYLENAKPTKVPKLMMQLLKLISIVAIVLNVIFLIRIAFKGPYGTNVLRNIRYLTGYQISRDVFTEYSMAITKSFFLIILYKYNVEENTKLKKWFLITLIASVLGVFTTVARTQVLSLVLSWLYIISLKNRTSQSISNKQEIVKKREERLRLLLSVLFLIFVFYYFALKTLKVGGMSISEDSFFINKYMGRELYVFDTYIYGSAGQGYGYYSLGWITRVLTAFKLIKSPGIIENIHALFTHGAVASFMRAPYVDGGYFGVCFVMFIMGFINGFVYKRVLLKIGYWSIFYTSCIYSNILAFFDYQYMMTSQLYLFIILVFCGWRFERKLIIFKQKNNGLL